MKKTNLFAILSMIAIVLVSCGGAEEKSSWEDAMDEAMSEYEDAMDEISDEIDYSSDDVEETETADEGDSDEGDSDEGDSGEWDSLLDDYESFADDYIAAIKKQKADPTDMSVMTDMAALAPNAAKWSTKMSEAAATLNADQAGRMMDIQKKLAAALQP